nr:mfs gliotoxin efflux transporter glia [Quercus suber]
MEGNPPGFGSAGIANRSHSLGMLSPGYAVGRHQQALELWHDYYATGFVVILRGVLLCGTIPAEGECGARATDPLKSGFFAVVSGLVITIWDRYTFYMAAGSMLCTIAAGLLFTLDERSRLARPIGYQLLLGAGQGWAIQVPVIVGQAFSEPEDISATTAVILFFQMTGGAICISAGQSLFTNRLLHTLRYLAPQMDAREILQIGASDLRQKVAASQLPGVLQAYMIGIKDTFALGIALAGCAFLCTWIAPISRLATLSHRSPVPSPMVKAEA